jgi:hypothetical protein
MARSETAVGVSSADVDCVVVGLDVEAHAVEFAGVEARGESDRFGVLRGVAQKFAAEREVLACDEVEGRFAGPDVLDPDVILGVCADPCAFVGRHAQYVDAVGGDGVAGESGQGCREGEQRVSA